MFCLFNKFSYFCNGPKENELNMVPQMESCGLWVDILGARNIVAHHSSSLIYNVNNNVVEGFNNVIAKHVGGKRVNFSCRGNIIVHTYIYFEYIFTYF